MGSAELGLDPSGQDKAQTLAHMRDVLGALSDAVDARQDPRRGPVERIGLGPDAVVRRGR